MRFWFGSMPVNGTLDLLFFQSNGCQFWDARGRATVLPLILQAMGVPA